MSAEKVGLAVAVRVQDQQGLGRAGTVCAAELDLATQSSVSQELHVQ